MGQAPAPALLVVASLVWLGAASHAGSSTAVLPAFPDAATAGSAVMPADTATAVHAVTAPVSVQSRAADPSPGAFVETYCLTCHNDRARAGGLTLAGVDLLDVETHAALAEKALHKVRTHQMPPAAARQPAPDATRAVLATIERALDTAAAARPQPGRIGVHRLNRAEYANAIRDLLALEVDTHALLLPDEADEGFDNVAVSLALSPAHLERYLDAARHISRLAVGDPALGVSPGSTAYTVPKLLEQDRRVDEALPFGSRGGLSVRHHFPLSGEYTFKVRLRRQVYDYIIGMGVPQALDLRIDGRRVERFTVGGDAPGMPGPLTWNGEIVGETPWELFMHAADAGLEVRLPVEAGTRTVSASFVDTPWEFEGVAQPPAVDFGRGSDERYDGHAAVDTLAIAGPYRAAGAGDTASRRAIFTCTPATARAEDACATEILSRLARRAYRRPVTTDDVQTLLAFYDRARSTGGFETGIQTAIERMLVSFHFLFRVETDPARAADGAPYRLSDLDLASRLSFFLWSSIPDEELLGLAEGGRLRDPAVLEAQVRRLLTDPRSRALVENFGRQWLGLRKAINWAPDPNVFPEFDENLRRAFLQETALLMEDQLRADRSVLDLLTADYSFLNERLARHYAIDGVRGERYRRVRFDDDTRGGLLGQGGILMVTSYPDRTAPVLRGMWVLDTLLGMPPPPPPPDIPTLEARAPDGRALSMRAQMEQHRRNPACATCHVRMDPLGFALEHYDAVGRWRAQAEGQPVDATAVFADGTPLDGARGLRAFILRHEDDYIHTFTAKLLTYALGRHVDYRDQPALRAITRQTAAGGHRWSAIILAIVQSPPFQMRSPAS
ncbi:MAG: DUF1592 domain-containing protein [Vicinamibacterales bacterium]|nr:DUF1592 domain-containing protein [Vicinamibacterales bacterium]